MDKILSNPWAKLAAGAGLLWAVYKYGKNPALKTAALGALGALVVSKAPVVNKLYS